VEKPWERRGAGEGGSPAAGPQDAAPLFSLVMCVYGVERHIAQAVRCVLAQTCGDFELILVDDATPDASMKRALEAAAGDARVRTVRHGSNRGLSAARNTGLEAARGRYVCFPDPDDATGPDFLEEARAAIAACDPDVVVQGLTEVYHAADGSVRYCNPVVPEPCVARGRAQVDALVLPLELKTLLGYVNCKFVRRELVGATRFEEGLRLSEDFFFSIELFERAGCVAVVPAASYRYAKRPAGSLTSGFGTDYYAIHRRRAARLQRHQEACGLDDAASRAAVGGLYGRYVVSALERLYDPRAGLDRAARAAQVRAIFADELFSKFVPAARAQDSRVLAAALAVLRTRSVALALALGRAVHLARATRSDAFTKIQSQR
jgi:glycosyltransferase involved in cell wall biosynthesis